MLLSVDPPAFYEAATCFGDGVAGAVQNAEQALAAALTGKDRIAGGDPAGAEWAAEYDRVAGATSRTINDISAAALTVAGLLRQTGINHATADADSNPLGAILEAPTKSWDSIGGACVQVPSVAGGFIPAPAGWEQVAEIAAIIWPDGDPGKLREVASAWRNVASSLEGAWPSVSAGLSALDSQRSPEIDAARGVCITVGDSLTDTAAQCRALSDSTDALAGHIEEAQGKLREQIGIMLAETLLIEAVAVAAGVVTYGAGFVGGSAVAVANASKFVARLTAIMLRFTNGARAAMASMAWHSLDATTDSLRVIIAKTPTVAATAGVAGATKSLSALADRLAKSPWPMGPSPRGFTIEARLGGNLPPSFPTIDRWNQATGVATSIKSVNLGAKTYQDASKLRRLLEKYVDKMANFNGARFNGARVDMLDINVRELHVATPRGASAEQAAVLAAMQGYASSRGVTLIVEVVR